MSQGSVNQAQNKWVDRAISRAQWSTPLKVYFFLSFFYRDNDLQEAVDRDFTVQSSGAFFSVCFTFLTGLHFALSTPNSRHLFTMFGIRGRSPASNICCFATADNTKPLPHTERRCWLLETQHTTEAFCLTGEETKTQPWVRQARGPVNKMDSIFSAVGSFVDWDVKSLLLFIAVFLITADYIKNRRQASFPPGPWAWPIVGNMFTLDHSRTHESMTQVD